MYIYISYVYIHLICIYTSHLWMCPITDIEEPCYILLQFSCDGCREIYIDISHMDEPCHTNK